MGPGFRRECGGSRVDGRNWKARPMAQPDPADTAITHDPAYEAVAPDDFAAMLEVERYGRRSNAFDAIIGATHDHFWDPYNPAYLDFAQPFDLERQSLMPLERFPELHLA